MVVALCECHSTQMAAERPNQASEVPDNPREMPSRPVIPVLAWNLRVVVPLPLYTVVIAVVASLPLRLDVHSSSWRD